MQIDKILFSAVIALFTLSLMMSYSLSEYAVLNYDYESLHFFWRQLMFILIGILLIAGLSQLDPDRWFVLIGFAVFLLSLVAMAAMPFMPETLVKSILGAKRSIHVGIVSLAPVESFKVGFVFFMGWSFSRRVLTNQKFSLKDETMLVLPYLFIFGIAVVLVAVLQNDTGQTAVLAVTLMTMFIFAGRSVKLFVSLLSMSLLSFATLIWMAPDNHRMSRIISWWSTVQDTFLQFFPDGIVSRLRVDAAQEPYQIANSLNAMKNGGYWGQGLGGGQFKLGYLSEIHTDFVLSGIAEELGYVGLVVVALLILTIVYRLFKIAAAVEDPKYYLFSAGIGMVIMFSFVINSYGISGLTPIKGIAVPFLSYGGSQILASSLAVGMVLMVSKTAKRRTI